MNAECTTNACVEKPPHVGVRNGRCFRRYDSFIIHHSSFCLRRSAAFSLIEILIAMFIFLIGILGVLSMLPVAMSSAARSIGQVRANILAQSVLAQLTADCRVHYVRGTVKTVLAPDQIACALDTPYGACLDDEWNDYYVSIVLDSPVADSKGQSRRITDTVQSIVVSEVLGNGGTSGQTLTDLTKAWIADEHVGRWLRLTSGPESGELRIITANTATTLTLSSGFTTDPMAGLNYDIVETQLTIDANWNLAPVAGSDRFTITRLGLPDRPIPGAFGEFGLERDFYVRRIIGNDTIELGRLDTLEPVKGTVTNSTATTLEDNTQNWTADLYNNCTVLLLSGTGAGQQRLITDTEETPQRLTISPAWDDNPLADTTYEILSINPIKYDSGALEAAGSTTTTGTLQDTDKSWNTNEFVDHLVHITSGTGTGQVRRIRENSGDTLTVSGPWRIDPTGGDSYEIGWPDGTLDGANEGFVVVTSGRAEGRVYEVTGSTIQDPGGANERYEITCGGASLLEAGVTEARRQIVSPLTAFSYVNYKHKPSDATTVAIIGNSGHLRSVLPAAQDGPLNYANEINTFGTAGSAQTAYDVFGAGDAYGSEYSVVAVFSDSGTLPAGPVRVDVLVFRNFDNMRGVAQNKKPVGFLTGYIGRP